MQSTIKEGVLIISPQGNLLSEQGNAEVFELLNNNLGGGTKKILFNLGAVNVINSNGLAILLTALSKTKTAGGAMALCSLPDSMKKLLRITRLENTFSVHADEANALLFLNN